MNIETIKKLLLSGNDDDVILGLTFIKEFGYWNEFENLLQSHNIKIKRRIFLVGPRFTYRTMTDFFTSTIIDAEELRIYPEYYEI